MKNITVAQSSGLAIVNDVFADVNVVNIKLSQELLTRSEQLEPKDGLSLRPR